MAAYSLPFEKPIVELQEKLDELKKFSQNQDIDVNHEVERMEQKIMETRLEIFDNLTPWQKVLVARHPTRPYFMDYVNEICANFTELHGDRIHADDRAIIGGLANIGPHQVMIIGTQKGRDMKSNLECNFGCAYPEGYRKALRLMKLAAKFKIPIITLIDTPGAYPGIESEERHIAEAIAVNLREMFTFDVPIIATVIGEGGSGGALGIGVGDRVLILEYAYYSVISPEGCAAILWKDRAYADKAADALKLIPEELLKAGMVDQIIPEPPGGAHSNPSKMAETLKEALIENLEALKKQNPDELMQKRYEKFANIGYFKSEPQPEPTTVEDPEDISVNNEDSTEKEAVEA